MYISDIGSVRFGSGVSVSGSLLRGSIQIVLSSVRIVSGSVQIVKLRTENIQKKIWFSPGSGSGSGSVILGSSDNLGKISGNSRKISNN